MIGNALESLLGIASADSVTELFIWIMLAIFATAVTQAKSGKHNQFLEHAPSVLVSLGILGTFIGIVIGLLDFDSHDIKNSIEGLLDGLKTAFITSLFGMTLSIVLKGLDTWWFAPLRAKEETPDDVTPEHIYAAMTRQEKLLASLNNSLAGDEEGSVAGQLKLLRTDIGDFRQGMTRQEKLLASLNNSLAGNEEGSVAGQLKLLRTDINDFRQGLGRDHREFREALLTQLDRFAEMLSRSATEAVVDALRQVIQDFNRHLVEQFGDNFKALNESVGKMNEWQERYKQHVESLEARLETAVLELERTANANEAISRSLISSEQSIGSIDTHCQSIPAAIGQLDPVLQVNQHQIQELQRHLDAFVALRDQATRAVPELQGHMDALSQQLSEKIGGVMTTMHEGALEFGRSVERTNTALTEASHVVSSQTEQISESMKDAAQDFNASVRGTLEAMLGNAKSLEQQMSLAVTETTRSLADEFGRVTQQLQGSLSSTVEGTLETLRTSIEGSLGQTETQIQSMASRTLGAVEAQVREATERANESLQAQLKAMDLAIGRELEKVFKEMGSALATISRRIADDHAELTERMRAQ